MKMKLSTAWISTGAVNNSQGCLEIENVGNQTIYQELPRELVAQIEEFYIKEYHARMKKAMEAL